jgi:hypothetical protein
VNVSDILSELDDHGFSDASTTRKMAVINDAYHDVCGREPWPFLEKYIDLTFDGSSAIPTNMPADFHAVIALNINNSVGGNRVQYMRYDDFLERHNSTADLTTTSAAPMNFYWPDGNPLHLSFWPIPVSTTTVRLWYVCTPSDLQSTDLEATILIPKQYHRATLVNGAIYRLDAMEDDLDIASGFQQFYEAAITRMRDWMWRRQYDRPEIVHPYDLDDLGGGGMFDISSWGA